MYIPIDKTQKYIVGYCTTKFEQAIALHDDGPMAELWIWVTSLVAAFALSDLSRRAGKV
jgi:hypothetical protein